MDTSSSLSSSSDDSTDKKDRLNTDKEGDKDVLILFCKWKNGQTMRASYTWNPNPGLLQFRKFVVQLRKRSRPLLYSLMYVMKITSNYEMHPIDSRANFDGKYHVMMFDCLTTLVEDAYIVGMKKGWPTFHSSFSIQTHSQAIPCSTKKLAFRAE